MVRPVSTPAHIEGSPAHSSHCAATALSTTRSSDNAPHRLGRTIEQREEPEQAHHPQRGWILFADQRSFALDEPPW